ncbi:MAG: hypothetical protein ACLVJG_10025 [Coprococcus comes]
MPRQSIWRQSRSLLITGQWDSFKKQIEKKGIQYTGSDLNLNGKIYAITLDADSYDSKNSKKNPVLG